MRRTRSSAKPLAEGEGVLVEQAKNRVQAQLDGAKAAYKEAYETGDPDKLIEAQEQLTALQNEKFRVEYIQASTTGEGSTGAGTAFHSAGRRARCQDEGMG